jgi:hypothetical protein
VTFDGKIPMAAVRKAKAQNLVVLQPRAHGLARAAAQSIQAYLVDLA